MARGRQWDWPRTDREVQAELAGRRVREQYFPHPASAPPEMDWVLERLTEHERQAYELLSGRQWNHWFWHGWSNGARRQ